MKPERESIETMCDYVAGEEVCYGAPVARWRAFPGQIDPWRYVCHEHDAELQQEFARMEREEGGSAT